MIRKIISIAFAVFAFLIFKNNFTFAKQLSKGEIYQIQQKFLSSPVVGTILNDCNIYKDETMTSILYPIKVGKNVEILEDRSTEIYYILSNTDNIKGWVNKEDLFIPETPISNKDEVTSKEVEVYINNLGISSDTNFLIFTDIARQQLHILEGYNNNWKIKRTFSCGTGLNVSPTTRGIFKTSESGEWFYSERLGSGSMYWTRFNGSYLIHSQAMNENREITDNTIGERCSSGCIRLEVSNAKWIYENIPEGTSIFID